MDFFNTDNLPHSGKITLVLRHSNRFPIPSGEDGLQIGLTPEGKQNAQHFGQILGAQYHINRLAASSVQRCLDTANLISQAARWGLKAQPEEWLSYRSILNYYDHLAASYPEIGPIPQHMLDMVCFMVGAPGGPGELDLMITHDVNIACLTTYLFGENPAIANFPGFLEGIAFWHQDGRILARYRDHTVELQDMLEKETTGFSR